MPETIYTTTDKKIWEAIEAACAGMGYCDDLTTDIGLLLEPGLEMELFDTLMELIDQTDAAIHNLREIFRLFLFVDKLEEPERVEEYIDERAADTAKIRQRLNDLQSRAAAIEEKSGLFRVVSMTMTTREIEAQKEMDKLTNGE